ncbi:imelysin family protein [Citreimonas sp.]|uniref:imelysin family protein n=1 Tax=Citreimonas sp. TaxID=3036715 RepID=UPI004057CC6A
MKPLRLAALIVALAAPASADVDGALDRHILPALGTFAAATETLADTAARDCRPEAVRPAYQAAFDAWMPVADLRLGPSETGALSIAFWPDSRGFTPRTLTGLIADGDPVARDVAGYADVSIAARGLFALDMLLYDDAFADYAADSYSCALVATIAADLDRQAEALSAAWADAYAETLRSAGASGNATFLTEDEAVRALYTQILSGLEFTADQRLGAPLGTFDRPRPTRAEARRSGRSLRNVVLAAQGAHDLATALAEGLTDGALPQTAAAMETVRDAADAIDDPAFQDITDSQARLRAEVLQQAVRGLRDAIAAELGAPLGIAAGFNSQDGD